MYVKICPSCSKKFECCITYEPDNCECGNFLIEDEEATREIWDKQKREANQSPFRAASFVRKVTTIGQLADANMKRMGKAEVEERLAANKTKRAPAGDNMSKREMELPQGSTRKTMTPTKIDRSLVGATKEQLIKYIETGVKPVKSEPTMKERKQLRREKQLEKQGKKTRIIST